MVSFHRRLQRQVSLPVGESGAHLRRHRDVQVARVVVLAAVGG